MTEDRKLTEYEEEILRQCGGLVKPTEFGAGVGAAIESLRGSGYIDKSGRPTPKGWDYLDEMLVR